jgi:AraC family transcriptional regulator
MRVDRPMVSVRQWPGMRSEYVWLPPDDQVTTTKPYQIGVSFNQHTQVVHEHGGRARCLAVPAGAVFANGSEEIHWAEATEPTEAVEIYPDMALLRAIIDSPQAGTIEIESVTAGRDATVLGLAAVLKRAHIRDLELDAMEASSVAHRLVEHLADHYCRPRPRPARRPRRLDRSVVDRIAVLVEERLGEPLVLDDLAAEARLSVYHFARAFKSTTGMAPHQFVTMRRMERAKTLLLAGRASVSEIAHAVGYLNVGHFRRLFRRYTGFQPSDLRRSWPPDPRRQG